MPVVSTEIKLMNPVVVNTDEGATTNGGRMTTTEITSGVNNNVWPDVFDAERTAGSTKYRKLYVKIANDADLNLQVSRIYLSQQSNGGDKVYLFAGTQTDTQASITGSERVYGCGDLDANASSGATTIDVATEDGADLIFQNGDLIWIGDGTNEEFVRLDDTGGVSYATDLATLTFETGEQLQNSYLSATPTKVASVIETGTIEASYTGVVETAVGGGTYTEVGNLTLDHIGTLYETWTITMGAGTSYTCVGDTIGSVGAGDRTTTFSPSNPAFGKPYFNLASAGWQGTWANGDTYVFTSIPAATPYWEKRIIPAATAAVGANTVKFSVNGQSG